MRINNYKVSIQAPIDRVWHYLTDRDLASQWMNHIKVETTYQPGSAIIFTAYGIEGKVAMSWRGIVEVFQPPYQLTINYKGFNNLLKTSYLLQTIEHNYTQILCSQDCTTYDAAKQLGQYTKRSLSRLKDMAEKNYL